MPCGHFPGSSGLCCQNRGQRGLPCREPGELPQHCSGSNEQVKGLCRLGHQFEDTTKELRDGGMKGDDPGRERQRLVCPGR